MNKTEYDGIISKPPMEEVLYHGAFHKYLNKYMGKNGKWVYVYNQVKGAANKAAGAASGAVSKAKAALPGLQKQAMSTAVSTRNKVGSAVSSGSKQASTLKKQAKNKISKMLPILSKRLKKAQHQATGVKLLARDKTKKLKKTAKGTFEQAKKKGSEAAKKAGATVTGRAKQIKAGNGKIKRRTRSQANENIQSHIVNDLLDGRSGHIADTNNKAHAKQGQKYDWVKRQDEEYKKTKRRYRRRARSKTVAGRYKY